VATLEDCVDSDARDARCQQETPPSSRSEAERDRDRVLYSPSFRRLAEVTQVVAPSSGYVFHNRLTHTLEVAQIGRRIAEQVTRAETDRELAEIAGGISPDVVEAAALVHDLGHPPFGHIAEDELQTLLDGNGISNGFEGNAQSFRIVTTLEVQRRQLARGLNLTRATLAASLKYPWLKPDSQGDLDSEIFRKHQEKWGAYDSERELFEWVRRPYNDQPFRRTVEAEIMDWADDVAYSVHDVEDFFRAGLIPLDRIFTNYGKERDRFLDGARDRLLAKEVSSEKIDAMAEALGALIVGVQRLDLGIDEPYRDTHAQRALLNELKSLLISRYVSEVRVREHWEQENGNLRVLEKYKDEVAILKELVWFYIINEPKLSAKQHGQRRIVSGLFDIFSDCALNKKTTSFPPIYRDRLLAQDQEGEGDDEKRLRVVTDFIASMTEHQAEELYMTLTGVSVPSA
jgi:dGTPase